MAAHPDTAAAVPNMSSFWVINEGGSSGLPAVACRSTTCGGNGGPNSLLFDPISGNIDAGGGATTGGGGGAGGAVGITANSGGGGGGDNTMDEAASSILFDEVSEFDDNEIADYFAGCADPNWKILITGPNGTGKTTFMSRIVLSSNRRFDEVFVMCNTHGQNAYDNLSFKYNRFECSGKDGIMNKASSMLFNELANRTVSDPDYKVLLIVDDVPKTVFCNPQFESLVRNARHNFISIIFITHDIRLVSPGVRPEFDIFMLSQSGKYNIDVISKTSAQAAVVCKQLAASIQRGATANCDAQCYLVSIFRRETDSSRAFYIPKNLPNRKQRSLPMIMTKGAYYFHTLMLDETLPHSVSFTMYEGGDPPSSPSTNSSNVVATVVKPTRKRAPRSTAGGNARKRKAASVVIPISSLIPQYE